MLENRIDDLKQYSKMDNVIISGLNVQYRTYARTASNLPMDNYSVQEAGTLEENVLAFLNKHNIPIEKSYVSICYPLKSKGRNSIILMKCSNRKAKLDVIKNAKKLKGSNVYINEHLTKRNSDLAHKLRLFSYLMNMSHPMVFFDKIIIIITSIRWNHAREWC